MKIISFQEFAAMPAGTIFSYYKPNYCEGLHQKGETLTKDDGTPTDYYNADLLPWFDFEIDPPTIVVDNSMSRWGFYDYNQLYAVYEEKDLGVISDMVGKAFILHDPPGTPPITTEMISTALASIGVIVIWFDDQGVTLTEKERGRISIAMLNSTTEHGEEGHFSAIVSALANNASRSVDGFLAEFERCRDEP